MYMYMYILLLSFNVFLFISLVPASRNEYQSIKLQLESETLPGLAPGDPPRSYHQLPPIEQASIEKKRLAGL